MQPSAASCRALFCPVSAYFAGYFDPAGHLVRHLRSREAADQSLVCRLRAVGRAARQRLDLAPPYASLADEFMAGSIAVRPAIADAEPMPAPTAAADTSLTSNAAHAGVGSSIGLLTPAAPQPVRRPSEPPTFEAVDLAVPLDEPSRYAARAWRSDAWERERERGQKPEVMVRRGL